MTYRNRTFLVGFLSIVLSIYGCTKAQLLGEYYLGDLYYQNPYHGYETLIFKTTGGINISLFGEGRHTTIHKGYVSVNSNDHYLWESDIASFISEDGHFRIAVYMEATRDNQRLSIIWTDYLSDTIGYVRTASGNELPLSPYNLYQGNTFLDSLVIDENVFYNVYADSVFQFRENRLPLDSSFILPTKHYYNTSKGVLKLDFSNGATWELHEIQ